MICLSSAVRVFVYSESCDMRCSFERLTALARNQVGEEPTSGHLFLFLNKTRTSVKVLYFDRTGYCIWYKKLESGTFSRPGDKEINHRDLSCLLEGIEENKIKQKKRYLLRKNADLVVPL